MQDSQTNAEIFRPDFLQRSGDLKGLFLRLLKGGLDKPTRDTLGRVTANYVQNLVAPHLNGQTQLDNSEAAIVQKLRSTGYVYLDNIFSDLDIAQIKAFAENELANTSGHGHVGQMRRRDITPDIGFAHYPTETVCRCPNLYRVLHDERLIKVMMDYLGAPPTIGLTTLWWSFPAPGGPEGMQMFHHDRGDFRSCNLFVYLTDVTEETGPHAFVERTHDMEILMPLAAERFGQDRNKWKMFWKWMEQHRKTDDEVKTFFLPNEIKVHTGPSGTSFLEDTRGLHKGTRPTGGARLAFEIFYAVLPKLNESIVPIDRNTIVLPPDLDGARKNLSPLVRYATRQLYS